MTARDFAPSQPVKWCPGCGDYAVLAAMKTLGAYPGILGTHRFDARGDTTLRTIGIFTIRNGQFEFLRAVGETVSE